MTSMIPEHGTFGKTQLTSPQPTSNGCPIAVTIRNNFTTAKKLSHHSSYISREVQLDTNGAGYVQDAATTMSVVMS